VALTDYTDDHAFQVTYSEVESARFGMAIARCAVPLDSALSPAEVAAAIELQDADITVLRYSTDRVAWYWELIDLLGGCTLIHADTLVYWVLQVGTGRGLTAVTGLAASTPTDGATIGHLTEQIFADYQNHYSANPLFSSDAVGAGYREWATTTPRDELVVLTENGLPIGLATTEMTEDHVEILLAGIVSEQRGRGRYPYLLEEVEKRASKGSRQRVVISTQSHNTSVQRAWARYGFLPFCSLNTIHVVRRDLWKDSGVVDLSTDHIGRAGDTFGVQAPDVLAEDAQGKKLSS
jgi:ribosomal protein S18 acetylase RimI-like enzyme